MKMMYQKKKFNAVGTWTGGNYANKQVNKL